MIIQIAAIFRIRFLDTNTESPELIWNDKIRQNVREQISKDLQELLTIHSKDFNAKWQQSLQTSDKMMVYNTTIAGELVVGGVFIRVFNQNPSFNLRHSKHFATELMEKVLELMQQPNEHLEPVTTALVSLLINHPSTADQVSFLYLYVVYLFL